MASLGDDFSVENNNNNYNLENENYESCSDNDDNSTVNDLVDTCLNMKPKIRPSSAKKVSNNKIKALIDRNTTTNVTKIGVITRKQSKTTTTPGKAGSIQDSIENLYSDMQSDLGALQTQFSNVNNRINDVFAILKNVSDRVDTLEGHDRAQSLLIEDLESRLIKQEFINSETERKARANQILLTHPNLNSSAADLNKTVITFIQNKFQLPLAKIKDVSARKIGPDDHTVLVSVPNESVVGDLFKIKKQLRNEKKDDHLFLNEFLTEFNYNLLKSLKAIKSACIKKKQPPLFYSVFSFRGRIYVKIAEDSDRILIKNKHDIKRLLTNA